MSVFAVPVAEMGLGMALSLARGIHTGHNDFRSGREKYGLAGNSEAELLSNADIGLVGFGNLGMALFRLLKGFKPKIRVFDPWIPSGYLERKGVAPASLREVLSDSRVVFVVASVTTENTHFLNRDTLCWMPRGSMLVLLSRAAVADFSALADKARSGRIRVATDVFPDEPVPANDPIRETPNMLLSAHRAGGLSRTLQQIGKLVLEDIDLISRGLPPLSCTRAQRETVSMMRSKPIEAT